MKMVPFVSAGYQEIYVNPDNVSYILMVDTKSTIIYFNYGYDGKNAFVVVEMNYDEVALALSN